MTPIEQIEKHLGASAVHQLLRSDTNDPRDYGRSLLSALRAMPLGLRIALADELAPWLPAEDAPKDGTPVAGSELYRYLPYKPEGRRQMRADGRWQRFNGYGWENSESPDGWLPALKSLPAQPKREG